MTPDYEVKLVRELIHKAELEIVDARFQRYFYSEEAKNPKTVGSIVAEERVELFEKRIKTVETHINLLRAYEKYLEKPNS